MNGRSIETLVLVVIVLLVVIWFYGKLSPLVTRTFERSLKFDVTQAMTVKR